MRLIAFLFLLPLTVAFPALAAQPQEALDPLREVSGAFEALVAQVNPAVVQVFAAAYVPGQGLVTSTGLITNQRSTGSGRDHGSRRITSSPTLTWWPGPGACK